MIRICPSEISGMLEAPSSKSFILRRLLLGALSQGDVTLKNVNFCDDTIAMTNSLRALGAEIEKKNKELYIKKGITHTKKANIDCLESAATLRFLLPVVSLFCEETIFNLSAPLLARPVQPLLDEMARHGTKITYEKNRICVQGKPSAGNYSLLANVSSQFISGLLFLFSAMEKESTLTLTTKLESSGYVDMTIDALRDCGVKILRDSNCISVFAPKEIASQKNIFCEGDWSLAAFFLCAAAASGREITMTGLKQNSLQPDKAILDILRKFGANIKVANDTVRVLPSSLNGANVDFSQFPDLAMPCAVLAMGANKRSILKNTKRLQIKESNRQAAIVETLNAFEGVKCFLQNGDIVIEPSKVMKGTEVKSFHDHRIVMMEAMLSFLTKGNILIDETVSVNKSYPAFFEDFKKCGGIFYEL